MEADGDIILMYLFYPPGFLKAGYTDHNAHIESFNGSLREECLNTNWFMSLEDAKEKLERGRNDCNEHRPHSVLTTLPQAEFARNHAAYGLSSTSVFLIEIEPLFRGHPYGNTA